MRKLTDQRTFTPEKKYNRHPRKIIDANRQCKIHQWYLYIIRACDCSLYTGITIDVERRFSEHRGKGTKGAKYLKSRRPLKLVYQILIGDRVLAMKMELKVKKLTKQKKENLITGKFDIQEIMHQIM